MAEVLSAAAERLARDLSEEGLSGHELADEIERELRSDRPDTTTRSRQEAAAKAAGVQGPGEGERAFKGHQEQRERQRAQLGQGFRKAGNVIGAKRTILGIALAVLVIGIVRDVRAGRAFTSDVVARRLFGTFVAAILLLVLSGPMPGVAKGLALVMGASMLVVDGKAIAGAIRGGATAGVAEPEDNVTPIRRGAQQIV